VDDHALICLLFINMHLVISLFFLQYALFSLKYRPGQDLLLFKKKSSILFSHNQEIGLCCWCCFCFIVKNGYFVLLCFTLYPCQILYRQLGWRRCKWITVAVRCTVLPTRIRNSHLLTPVSITSPFGKEYKEW
jgi:hypothetical protein